MEWKHEKWKHVRSACDYQNMWEWYASRDNDATKGVVLSSVASSEMRSQVDASRRSEAHGLLVVIFSSLIVSWGDRLVEWTASESIVGGCSWDGIGSALVLRWSPIEMVWMRWMPWLLVPCLEESPVVHSALPPPVHRSMQRVHRYWKRMLIVVEENAIVRMW